METCEHCHTQLLDYLYDLLEPAERQALEGHLAGCATCRAALDGARAQQRLFARAAKVAVPATRFVAPAEAAPAAADRPATLPLPTPKRARWGRWVAAAAAVLFLVGIGAPGGWYGNDYLQARRAVKDHESAVAQAEFDLRNVDGQLIRADRQRQQKEEDLVTAARAKQLKVIVSGPETVQPGAPNKYTIQTRNLNEQPVATRLTVRVRDEAQNVLHEEKDVASAGDFPLALPANLPVQPNAKLALEVVARRDGAEGEVREELALAAPLYVTHLATDKPMYHPGETVYFRSLTLERFSLKPPEEDFQVEYKLKKPSGEVVPLGRGLTQLVRDDKRGNAAPADATAALRKDVLAAEEKGKPVAAVTGPDGKPLRGVGSGAFLLGPDDGGEFALIVSEVNGRFPEQQRKFLVNRYERPHLNKELEWAKKSYGPGEDVVANCKATRAEGGFVANQPVQATVSIDGKTYDAKGQPSDQPIALRTDAAGGVQVRFHLPEAIERGQATLSVNFFDGGNDETMSKPIPLVLKKLAIDFYPEGGELVAGVANRVYFQVRNTLGKPAELRGKLVEDGTAVKATVETFSVPDQPGANQGMGVFEFTPAAGKKYELKVEAPIGIQGKYELPEVKADGVGMTIPVGVTGAADPIRVVVRSPSRDRSLLVGAYCRGRLMDHRPVVVKKGSEATVELKPAQGVGGVYRVTVFEELKGEGARQGLQPVAERLVYRVPEAQLKLAAQPDRKLYIPGDKVTLGVTAATEKGDPAPAVVLVAVVDKSVVTLADEKTARSMPTHFFLTTEVRRPEDLEHADFLLSVHPKAKDALDLLLGTQGWRRFAEQDPEEFRKREPAEAERLLVTIGQSAPKTTDFLLQDKLRLGEDYQKEFRALTAERAGAVVHLNQARTDPAAATAAARVAAYDRWIDRLQWAALPVLTVVLVLAALIAFLVAVVRNAQRYVVVAGLATLAALMLFAVTVVELAREQQQRVVAVNAEHKVNQGLQLGREEKAVAGAARDFAEAEGHVPQPNAPAPEDMPAPANRFADDAKQPMPAPPPGKPQAPPAAKADPAQLRPQFADKRDKKDLDGVKGKDDKPVEKKQQNGQAARDMDKMAGFRRVDELKKGEAEILNKDRAPIADGKAKLAEEQKEGLRRQLQAMDKLEEGMLVGPGEKDAVLKRLAAPLQPLLVREYAHLPATHAGDARSDFAETLLWQPALVLPDGKAEVAFQLPDSVTTFQVAVMGHTLDGRIGALTTNLEARLPFALEPKLPIEVSSSDKIDVPVTVANNTPEPREVALRMSAVGLALRDGEGKEGDKKSETAKEVTDDRAGGVQKSLAVPADQRRRQLLRLQPSIVEGTAELFLEGETRPFAADSIRRTIPVVPDGFPVIVSRSDLLERVARHEVVLPETWVKGTLKLQAEVYPSTLADLQKGLEGLLREPNGCFEQTSTANYPNLLILDYLKESDQANPQVEERARAMLARGYDKLTSFECPYTSQGKHGYEWFGAANSAHEALTAYGLLQFRDMARVHKVDPAMLDRTRAYLMDQRDGKGGFKRNARALDTFGRAPDDVTNAYIVWALTESGKDDDVSKELAALADQAKGSKDPYFLALVANSLLNRDRADEAVALLKTVAAAQQADGHLDAAKTSITGSGGRDLQIETTALATLGWLKANRPAEFNTPVQKAVKWIGQQRGGHGSFGSTQSTILALKALIAHARANKKTAEGGELRLLVGGQVVAKKAFEAGTQDVLTVAVPDAERLLKPGKNDVQVEITGDKNVFPCTVSWSYRTLTPASADGAPVRLRTALDRQAADEGETVHLTVGVENVSGKGQGMTVAVVGLPAGLSLPEDLKQLKQHAELRDDGKEPGLISYFEVRGRELVLYWRDLAPGAKVEVPLDLICRVPGEYRGPASRAYLYYNADVKHWVEPLAVRIKAKE